MEPSIRKQTTHNFTLYILSLWLFEETHLFIKSGLKLSDVRAVDWDIPTPTVGVGTLISLICEHDVHFFCLVLVPSHSSVVIQSLLLFSATSLTS